MFKEAICSISLPFGFIVFKVSAAILNLFNLAQRIGKKEYILVIIYSIDDNRMHWRLCGADRIQHEFF
jgi:hypothetical protein